MSAKVYNSAVVLGPEGSGTYVFTDIVSKITGWPRADPSIAQLNQLYRQPKEHVYHVSLPAFRPEIWWEPDARWSKSTAILSIVRSSMDSTFSAWKRFGRLAQSDPTVEHYWRNHLKARELVWKHNDFFVIYESMCREPQALLDRLARFFNLPGIKYGDLGISLVDQNGKYGKSARFMREVRLIDGFKGVI
jgi:hypothetical protein